MLSDRNWDIGNRSTSRRRRSIFGPRFREKTNSIRRFHFHFIGFQSENVSFHSSIKNSPAVYIYFQRTEDHLARRPNNIRFCFLSCRIAILPNKAPIGEIRCCCQTYIRHDTIAIEHRRKKKRAMNTETRCLAISRTTLFRTSIFRRLLQFCSFP